MICSFFGAVCENSREEGERCLVKGLGIKYHWQPMGKNPSRFWLDSKIEYLVIRNHFWTIRPHNLSGRQFFFSKSSFFSPTWQGSGNFTQKINPQVWLWLFWSAAFLSCLTSTHRPYRHMNHHPSCLLTTLSCFLSSKVMEYRNHLHYFWLAFREVQKNSAWFLHSLY